MSALAEATTYETAGRSFDALALKLLYTVDDVAVLLGVGRSTVEKLIHDGYLASGIVQGTERSRRISRRQLDAFIEQFDGAFPTSGKPQSIRKPRMRAS